MNGVWFLPHVLIIIISLVDVKGFGIWEMEI